MNDHDTTILNDAWDSMNERHDSLRAEAQELTDWVWVKNGLGFLPLDHERVGRSRSRIQKTKPEPMGFGIDAYAKRSGEIVYSTRRAYPKQEKVFEQTECWLSRAVVIAGELTVLILLSNEELPSRSLTKSITYEGESQLEETYSYEDGRLTKITSRGFAPGFEIDYWYDASYDAKGRLSEIYHRSERAPDGERVFKRRVR